MNPLTRRVKKLEDVMPKPDALKNAAGFRWICDVRVGHEEEDMDIAFAAIGAKPSWTEGVMFAVYPLHQWPEDKIPSAREMPFGGVRFERPAA